jgi:hypothetical protein
MNVTRQIPPADWQGFFDSLTRDQLTLPKAATIEVVAPDLGDQVEVRATRLVGFTYDPSADAFSVILDDVTHTVSCPAEIWIIEEDGGFVSTLGLLCGGGKKEIIYVGRSGTLARFYG